MNQTRSDKIAALKYTVCDELEGAHGHWLDGWLSDGTQAGRSCVKCGAEVKLGGGALAVRHGESPAAYLPCGTPAPTRSQ